MEALREVPGFDRLTDRARKLLKQMIGRGTASGPTVAEALDAFLAEESSVPGFVLRSSGLTRKRLAELDDGSGVVGEHRNVIDVAWLVATAEQESRNDETAQGLYVGCEHLFLAAGQHESFSATLFELADVDDIHAALLSLLGNAMNSLGVQTVRCVLQTWVMQLTFMQQSVLMAAVRGPDGLPKSHIAKDLCRWLRRCVFISAFDGVTLTDPYDRRGGSFTGPCRYPAPVGIDYSLKEYLDDVDVVPHHFHLHLMHAAEILGYKHPEAEIRDWWQKAYKRFAVDMHLQPETESMLDQRLGDNKQGWQDAHEGKFTSLKPWVMLFEHEFGQSVFEFNWRGEFDPVIAFDDERGAWQLSADQQLVLDASGFQFDPEGGEELSFQPLVGCPPTLG
jgi:hypothetical protein